MAHEVGGGIAGAGHHLVVVVAHPDDETFGCGSLIAQAASAGARVTVLCATRGEAGERTPDAATDHLPLGQVRERELRAAAAVLGVHAVELLNYADSGWDGPIPAGGLCAVAIDELADVLDDRLTQLGPDVVLILEGDDGHRDHHHVRAAVEMVFARRPSQIRLVWACLSNRLMRLWIDEMRAHQSETVYLDLDLDRLGSPDARLTAIDVSAQVEVRERAIACHRSQSSPFDGLSAELRHAFLATSFVRESQPGGSGQAT